ncbi:MAG: NAD(P)-binding protein [bacterium]|nr:NAD(P)-binding protein [bacterium]
MAVELGLEEPGTLLRARSAQRIGISEEDIHGLRIARRSVDARRRGRTHDLRFVYHVDLDLDPVVARSAALAKALKSGRAREIESQVLFEVSEVDPMWRRRRVVIVGAGPAGLYAAWTLATNGVAVDLIDRGPALRKRGRAVARFTATRELDPENNLLFGEGGAGTYSDGKLYTRTQHPLAGPILQTLIDAGADPEIAFDARAHIGTDRLHRILPRLRRRLEEMGVRFHFETRLEGLVRSEASTVSALRTSAGEFPCDGVILGLGHSARDTLRSLAEEGLILEAKPFQIGLRIEHPQALIDEGRYGPGADLERLGHAYYSLVAKSTPETSAVHSFCMCPGGQIVAAVAQPGMLCTNGMSNSRHSSPFANSGLVVSVGPGVFGDGVFAGVEFQEGLETAFFEAGGGDYTVPAQRVKDFLKGRASSSFGRSSYKMGLAEVRIDELLPARMTASLRGALRRFDKQIPGYAGEEGLLVGVESRSSGPLRIPRDRETRLAPGFANLWPVGEGAGFSGGIMSAAIDGARSAWALLGHRESK